MPELEYTIEVVSEMGLELPDAQEMAEIIHLGIREWAMGETFAPVSRLPYLDVEVTRVSDDL
jgi:hypothetical protein